MWQVVECKSEPEINKMRQAGRIVAQILAEISQKLQPGWSTADIDAYAEHRVADLGGKPSFKGYHGFPGCVCVSINQEVVHGIPSPRRRIRAGDVVKVDLGCHYQGWHADSCLTIGVEPLTDPARALIAVAEQALIQGLDQVRHGVLLQDISAAIQDLVEQHGYSVVKDYVGHGVGRNLHEDPQIPNYRAPDLPNPRLKSGMTLAIEPIVNLGSQDTRKLADQWTVVTADGQLSAQFEHTVLVTPLGHEILTDRTPFIKANWP